MAKTLGLALEPHSIPFELADHRKYYGTDFLPELQQRVINTTTVMMIQLLDLPIPEMLRQYFIDYRLIDFEKVCDRIVISCQLP